MARKIISKEELLLIASGIVKEHGLDSCSIRALSKEAGVAVGTIYNYFPSRKIFLEELFKNSWDITLKRLLPINISKETPEKRLEDFAYTLKSDIEDRKGLGKELYGDINFKSKMCVSHKEIFEEILLIISSILKESSRNCDKEDGELFTLSRWIIIILIDTIVKEGSSFETALPLLKKQFL